ncbi:hypothetical protein [Oligella urethralis]|uniref:hypothetical protein n=1 Tax=Oligella urethralis TaxID=90245 RepID=UPI00288BF938|nr:hypothetical protein [Oligella urethralis]
MTLAKFSLFEINKCGFYSRNGREFEFGTLKEVLEDLKTWVDGKPLRETKTFEVKDGDNLNPVYLCNIYKHNSNAWVVTTWNETESTESGVASIDGSAIVGQAEITISKIPEDGIPGFPTYFWIIPQQGVIVSVRFEHLKTGLPEYRDYMINYLGFFSKYVVMNQNNQSQNDIEILGHRKNAHDDIDTSVRPLFKTTPIQKPGQFEEIRNNCAKITKITSKTILQRSEQIDRALWQKMLEKMGLGNKEFVTEETLIKYDFRSTITERELDIMIQDWEENQHLTTWYDYGFHIRGRQNPLWLSGSHARGEVELPIIWTGAVLNPKELANALYSVRDVVLRTVNSE